jgi:hypothetical protein
MTRGVVVFWVLLVAFIAVDFSRLGQPRVEPAAFALGSGQSSEGGHCSGR